MTENKRFNVFDVDGTIFLEDHKEGSYHIGKVENVDVNCLNDIADRLNELDSENTELKKVLQYETQMHNKWKTECITETQENNKIKNTINEMYNNERTHIGQNVLKQLLEAIQ